MSAERIWIWSFIGIGLLGVRIGASLSAPLCFNLGNVHTLQSVLAMASDGNRVPVSQGLYSYVQRNAPRLPRLPFWRGYSHLLAGQQGRAVVEWHASPDATYWLALRGRSHIARREFEIALSVLETASMLNSASSTIRYYGGLALHKMGRTDEAQEWYNAAIELSQFDERFISTRLDVEGSSWWPGYPIGPLLSPTEAHTYLQMSNLFYGLWRAEMARDMAQAGLDAEPDDPLGLGYAHLGAAYYRMAADSPEDAAEYYELAERALLSAVDRLPNTQALVLHILGRVYWRQGKTSEAAAQFDRVLQESSDVFLQDEIAGFYTSIGQHQVAISIYDAILARTLPEPRFADYWIHAAEGHLAAGRRKEACSLFETGVGMAGDIPSRAQGSALLEVCTGQE